MHKQSPMHSLQHGDMHLKSMLWACDGVLLMIQGQVASTAASPPPLGPFPVVPTWPAGPCCRCTAAAPRAAPAASPSPGGQGRGQGQGQGQGQGGCRKGCVFVSVRVCGLRFGSDERGTPQVETAGAQRQHSAMQHVKTLYKGLADCHSMHSTHSTCTAACGRVRGHTQVAPGFTLGSLDSIWVKAASVWPGTAGE